MSTAQIQTVKLTAVESLRADFTLLGGQQIVHATFTDRKGLVHKLDDWRNQTLCSRIACTHENHLLVALHECFDKGKSSFATGLTLDGEQWYMGKLELSLLSKSPQLIHGTFVSEIENLGFHGDFEKVFEKIHAPIWILDESGLIVRGNEQAARILGYSIGELSDSSLLLFNTDEWSAIQKQFKFKSTKSNRSRFKFQNNLNVHLELEATIEIVAQKSDNHAEGFNFYLVTALEEAETLALRRFLNLSGHQAIVGTWEVDPSRNSIHWSEQCYRIFELDENTPLERDNLLTYFETDADRLKVTAGARRAFEKGSDFSMSAGIITAKGNRRRIQLSGHNLRDGNGKTYVTGTIMDITAQEIKEKSLQLERERFKTYVENSLDVTFELSPTGEMLYVSPNWPVFTGFSKEEIERTSFTRFVHPEDVLGAFAYLENLLKLGYSMDEFEYRALQSDGNYRWHSARGLIRESEGEITIVGSARDIHDAVLSKKLLADSESRLKTISENIPGAIYQTASLVDGSRHLVYLSDKITEILKYPKGAILKHWRDAQFVVEEHREGYLRSINDALIEKKPWFYECKVKCGDGQVKWLQGRAELSEIDGEVIFNGLILDVSDLKFAEEAMRESEARFKAIFENGPECVKIISKQGVLQEINGGGLRLLETDDKSMLVGKHIKQLVFPEDAESLWMAFEKAVNGKPATTVYRTWAFSGKVIHMENQMVPMFNSHNEVVDVLSVSRDISRHIESERAINNFAQRLKLAIETERMGLWEYSIEDGKVHWDERVFQIYGVDDLHHADPQTVWLETLGADEAKRLSDLFLQSVEKGIDYEAQFIITDKHGKRKFLHNAARPLYENGKILQYVGIVRDDSKLYDEQEKLAQSEREFRMIFDTVLDGIFVIEINPNLGFTLTHVNRAVEEITKLSKEQLIAQPLETFLSDDAIALATYHLKNAVETRQPAIWEQSVEFAGEMRDLIISVAPIYDNDEFSKLLGSVKDVTALRSAEIEINRLALVSRTSTNGAVMVDMDGRIIWANQTFERIIGMPLEQLKGKKRAEVGVGEDTDRYTLSLLKSKIADGSEFECEIVNYSSHYQKYWLRMQVQPIIGNDGITEGCFILETDISLRKAEEDQLRMLESVVMHTRDMVLVLDHNTKQPLQKQIVFVNQSFVKAMDKQASEVLYTSFYDLIELDKAQDAYRRITTAFYEQEPISLDIEMRSVHGEKFWLNIALTPLFDSDAVCTHWIAILRDVSSRIKREQERDKLIKELTQNNLDLKQFSFITSHNLRAPLTNLLSIASLLEPTRDMDADTVKLIEGFKTSTNNLNDILNDLIKIVLIKESSKEGLQRLSLTQHVNKVASLLSSQIELSRTKLNLNFSQVDEVLFEPSYMDSIFMNLITNSIRYAHPDRVPEISILSKVNENYVEICYTDNGIGIDLQRYGHKIFGLYQRFNSNPEGKGIGLYLVHSQVTALGGKITVESEPGLGATFLIKIPLNHGQ